MKSEDKDVTKEPKSEDKIFTLEEKEEIAMSEIESMIDREIQDAMPETSAVDFTDIEEWVNTEPLSLETLKGKVILLLFWAYTDIFCLRSLPIMRLLNKKYAEYDFTVVSVHCAEYDFAKSIQNVRKAVERYNVNFPVGIDKENRTWQTYGNMYWPKHVLIDPMGMVRYEIAGLSNTRDLELPIYGLLREADKRPPPYFEEEEPQDEIYDTYGTQFIGATQEIWDSIVHPVSVGYTKLKQFGNIQKVEQNEINEFKDPGQHLPNIVYLRGSWFWDKECIRFSGKPDDDAAVILRYSARRANAIMATQDNKLANIEVKIDGKYIAQKNLGSDVRLRDGISCVDVEWVHLYNLVKTEEPETHEIEIIPRTNNFSFYTLLFG
ncbi:MAG: redoxin domain-containing protein [Nitrososphaerales archaeon]